MGYCKMLLLIITFVLLCSGIFGQRFQRHLNAVSSPTAAATVKNVELNNFYLDYELTSDGSNGVQDGTNVNLTGPGEIELELLHDDKKLEFQICSKNCMGQRVTVCYDAENFNRRAKGECQGSKQCEFRAGVIEEDNEKRMWVEKDSKFKKFDDVNTCKSSRMQHPSSELFGLGFESCGRLKQNGKVVKLYVSKATQECPLGVIGAKIWFPPTPPPPTPTPELSTEKPTPSKPPPSSSTADSSNTLWIVIGVVSGILGIALLIGLGCLIYHCCVKKKSTTTAAAIADGKKNQISTETKTKTITKVQTPIVKQETAKEKAVEEKEEKKSGVQEKVTTTKEETEEPKPKKKASKRKSKKQKKKEGKEKKKVAPPPAPKAPTPNRTKPTQEETPPNATGPTFEETMAQSVVSREPVAPTLHVLEKIVVPERQFATSNREETDSLSGSNDLKMQMIVENPAQALARCYDNSDPRHQTSNDKRPSEAKMQEIKDFYPVGKKPRDFKREEISILCCRISTMFKDIESMRTTAKKKLEDHGAKFDKNGCIMKMPPGTLYYLQLRSTAEYVRAFAFGALFSEEIDRYTASQIVMLIPLLFDLILQPRYPVLQRRKACAWIRRQLSIIFKKYSLVELGRLAYPICAMKEAYFANRSGFYNSVLHTETKDEIEPPPSSYRPKGKLIEYNPMMDKM